MIPVVYIYYFGNKFCNRPAIGRFCSGKFNFFNFVSGMIHILKVVFKLQRGKSPLFRIKEFSLN